MTQTARILARHFLEVAPAVLHSLRSGTRDAATVGQLRCLHALEDGPCSLGELAQHYGVTAPTMSRMISALVERGWVSRAEAPADRRQLVLTLLPTGREALRDLHAQTLDQLSALLEELRPDERDALECALEGLERAVQARNARAADPHA